MSNDVIIVPTAEVLEHFKGRQLLERLIKDLEAKVGKPVPQLIIMSIDQLNIINQQMRAADYYMQKCQALLGPLDQAWKNNDKMGIAKAFSRLEAFINRVEEEGDSDGDEAN